MYLSSLNFHSLKKNTHSFIEKEINDDEGILDKTALVIDDDLIGYFFASP